MGSRVAAGSRAVALIALLLVAGCAGGQKASTGGSYAAEIKAAGKNATSDFERQVLADGQITRGEYEEAVQRLIACGKVHGVAIVPHDQSGYYVYQVGSTGSKDHDSTMSSCSEGTTRLIESIYSSMVMNPEHQDLDALTAACLVRTGLAKAGYSKADFQDNSRSANGGSAEGHFPFDVNDPRYAACLANPSSR